MANKKRFIRKLVAHYQFILNRDGDERLRRVLSASRAVWTHDPRLTKEQKADWLAGLDLVERRLLIKPRSRDGDSKPSV